MADCTSVIVSLKLIHAAAERLSALGQTRLSEPLFAIINNSAHRQDEDEQKAFIAWANKEYDVGEGYELNESNREVVENRKGWMARAALERKP